MRVLVTGASGQVGRAVAASLLEQGDEVVGLGRRLTRSNRGLTSAIAADLGSPGLASRLELEVGRCDAIVHAAASLDGDPFAASTSLVNGLGTQQMLELASRWAVQSFIYFSSVPLIGRPVELPITERHPIDPPSAYHASKLYGEHLLTVAARAGLPALSMRLSSPLGPGIPAGRIVPVFVSRALAGEPLTLGGNGTRGQDYVDVRDIASAVRAALGRRATGLLNIASGRCISNLELARCCVQVTGSSSEIRFSGEPDPEEGVRWEVSIAAAEREIDYRPEHALEDSIRDLADSLRAEQADD